LQQERDAGMEDDTCSVSAQQSNLFSGSKKKIWGNGLRHVFLFFIFYFLFLLLGEGESSLSPAVGFCGHTGTSLGSRAARLFFVPVPLPQLHSFDRARTWGQAGDRQSRRPSWLQHQRHRSVFFTAGTIVWWAVWVGTRGPNTTRAKGRNPKPPKWDRGLVYFPKFFTKYVWIVAFSFVFDKYCLIID